MNCNVAEKIMGIITNGKMKKDNEGRSKSSAAKAAITMPVVRPKIHEATGACL